VTIAALDPNWKVVPGTHRTFDVDTVLIAVGLAEVNEFYTKARDWGMEVYSAGDAGEIAEASAAMFTGKIQGLKIAASLGFIRGYPEGLGGEGKGSQVQARSHSGERKPAGKKG
jgi:hypothetical protein